VREALPAAEHEARVGFDPGAAVIGGASMGGLASLAAIARHPRVFRGAMAMSPSVWTVPDAIARELQRAKLPHGARVYVDVGLRESEKMVREATRAAAIVAARLPPEQRMWRPDRRGKHHEAAWKRRLPKALRFLLRR
jgi:predicted alpha/beta superfamily hydrolase